MNPEEKNKKTPEENPSQEKSGNALMKALRTYQGDVQEAISKNNFSKSTIVMAEQKRKIEQPEKVIRQEIPKVRNNLFIVIGGVLLVAGIVAVGGVYYMKSNEETVIQQEREKTLISFSLKKEIYASGMNRNQLIGEITSQKSAFRSQPNSVLYLDMVDANNNKVSVTDILKLLGPSMSASLARSFTGDYMVGVYSFDTNEPFVILTTQDYANSYSGMLKWEKDMVRDIGPLFSIETNNSTSTVFVDEEMRNKDLRLLRDGNGKTILLYTFIDKSTLVITKNENMFNAILGKYLIGQQVR